MRGSSNPLKKGDPIKKFIENIGDFFPHVSAFNFIIYKPSVGVERRIDKSITSKSVLFGERKWDFERQLIRNFDQSMSQMELIEKLLSHDTKEPDKLISVNSKNVMNWLNDTINSIGSEQAIGIVSKCTTNQGVVSHIPLMDFSCPPTENYERFIVAALNRIGCKRGILVNSGKSFHFYGLELQSSEEWRVFMSYSILLSPFTDVRYIGHRLISDYSILRVGENKIKPSTPKIIQVF
jgi:hypothetical protein